MKNKLNIPVIQGTTRPARQSIDVARLVHKVASEREEIEAILVDPREFEFPQDGNGEDQKDPAYSQLTEEADGFVIVVPEYNHSFPGSLKRMLDSELENYIHKPVAFAGVSAGPWGGVRAIESLVPAVREMGMTATFTDVQFPKVQDLFDDQGKLQDDSYIDRVNNTLDELVWMTKTLKWGRKNLSQ